MKTSVEPLEGNKVKLTVEVEEGEFEPAVDAAFRKISREVRVPGFRPGKVPRRLLESRIGVGAARQEALRDSLPNFYAKALRESEVDAIAPPEIDITAGEETGPIAFDAVVEVRPRVDVPGYGGLKAIIPSPNVSDEDVDRQIDRLRGSFAELHEIDRPVQDTDVVTIDIRAHRGDETLDERTDYSYDVGSGSIVDDLDAQLRGTKPGDILKFDVDVPEDEPVSFTVLVKDVKAKVLPEVTDEWASEASEFETVDELRTDLRTRLGAVKRVQAQMALRDEVVKALVELVDAEPPEALVGAEMERRIHDLARRLDQQGATLAQYLEATGTSQDDLIGSLREASIQAVKADLALRAVADAEEIDVTEDEIDKEIEVSASRAGQKPAQLRRALERAEQMPAVTSDIRKGKALEWLVEHVELVDEDGQPVDRADLAPPDELGRTEQDPEALSTEVSGEEESPE